MSGQAPLLGTTMITTEPRLTWGFLGERRQAALYVLTHLFFPIPGTIIITPFADAEENEVQGLNDLPKGLQPGGSGAWIQTRPAVTACILTSHLE